MWDTCTIWTEIFVAIKKKKKALALNIWEYKVRCTCPGAIACC